MELNNVKDLYDKQVQDLKKALDNMNQNYNQLKVGAEGLLHENEDLKNKLKKKEAEAANSNDRYGHNSTVLHMYFLELRKKAMTLNLDAYSS